MAMPWLLPAAASRAVRGRYLVLLVVRTAMAQTHVAWITGNATNGPAGGRASMAFAQQSLSGTGGGALADVLWMYGGISSAQPLSYSSELWGFTASHSSWEQVTALNSPPALVGSAMCAVGHILYLFGGANFVANAYSHLYSFDTARRSWARMLLSGHQPVARAYHAMSCAGGRVYMFGGEDASGGVLNTLNYLSGMSSTSVGWSAPTPAGNVPTPRKAHSLCAGAGKLYVFGGSGASGEKLSDAYQLDTTTLTWTALATSGDAPSGREGHTAVVLDQKLYIFGGADAYGNLNDVRVLDLGSLRWAHPRSSSTPPPPRWGHVGALINQRLYLYGGVSASQQLLDDAWSMSRHCVGTIQLTSARATFASGDGSYMALADCRWCVPARAIGHRAIGHLPAHHRSALRRRLRAAPAMLYDRTPVAA
jgi:hypothetical protein